MLHQLQITYISVSLDCSTSTVLVTSCVTKSCALERTLYAHKRFLHDFSRQFNIDLTMTGITGSEESQCTKCDEALSECYCTMNINDQQLLCYKTNN